MISNLRSNFFNLVPNQGKCVAFDGFISFVSFNNGKTCPLPFSIFGLFTFPDIAESGQLLC